MSLTPSERRLLGQLGAHESWAHTDDRPARTANARKNFDARFERQADPEGVLPPEERARRVKHLRQAYFARLSLKSAVARRKAAEARAAVTAFDAEADAADAELGGDR
ncbi:hypothetical protein GV794_23490 [Nocardia cyriacigeorgica]|uniref:Uncharacterized protein n=1 Tax=Nocardia cyriacigeorgica TaxID=135487 RepID=A0ABX0CQS2_9NOCA|nr:hypothetical protein [Nocardia cyriacigeorgica]NEW58584.1 hypothetical protein [Nocardia cyriacigeorgica]